MAVEAGPTGFGHRIRPVVSRDAGSIFSLRTDPELGHYLNPTVGDVHDQAQWIDAQRVRLGDYYFSVETMSGRWEGLIGLYGIVDEGGEWGRWILKRGSLAAPASVLLIMKFGFENLSLRRMYCRTLTRNLAVVRFHDACSYTSRREGTDAGGRDFIEHVLNFNDWPEFRKTLEPLAERVARRKDR